MPAVSKILPSLRILRTGSYTSGDPLQLMLFWLKNLFCLDLLAYNKAVDIISSDRASFLNFYCCYGMIDALLAISKLTESKSGILCEAEFNTGRYINAKNTFHPLLDNAVSNTVNINNGMLLTGSNMAGKSTFLRTIGLNCLLAQTIGCSYAEKIIMPFMNIVTVINKQDDLFSGESFYFYEAKRISNMLNRNDNYRYLFLIDELLSGTNSVERISASVAIIKHLLAKNNIISVIATHDISIASKLADNCECCYFSDYIKNNSMEFDYRLKKGIIKTTNAIRMLELLDLPLSVISEAKRLIEVEI